MEVSCEYCGAETEFVDCEWARYMNSYDEELVSVYKCLKCGENTSVRKEKRSSSEDDSRDWESETVE